eukprot:510585_1
MLAFTTIAPILFLTQQYAKWSRTINRSIRSAFGVGTSIATQAFSNAETVKAFGCEKKFKFMDYSDGNKCVQICDIETYKIRNICYRNIPTNINIQFQKTYV